MGKIKVDVASPQASQEAILKAWTTNMDALYTNFLVIDNGHIFSWLCTLAVTLLQNNL